MKSAWHELMEPKKTPKRCDDCERSDGGHEEFCREIPYLIDPDPEDPTYYGVPISDADW